MVEAVKEEIRGVRVRYVVSRSGLYRPMELVGSRWRIKSSRGQHPRVPSDVTLSCIVNNCRNFPLDRDRLRSREFSAVLVERADSEVDPALLHRHCGLESILRHGRNRP